MKGPKGLTDQFYCLIKSRKRSIFVIDSYLNDSVFTAVKRDAKFKTRYVKGVPFVNRRCTKGVPLSWKKGKGLDLGAKRLPIKIGEYLPPPQQMAVIQTNAQLDSPVNLGIL